MQVPRDHSWTLLHTVDHVPIEDVQEALEVRRALPYPDEYEPVAIDDEAVPELVFLSEQRGYDRLADRIVAAR